MIFFKLHLLHSKPSKGGGVKMRGKGEGMRGSGKGGKGFSCIPSQVRVAVAMCPAR